jgi:anti-sigma B factor antagonist
MSEVTEPSIERVVPPPEPGVVVLAFAGELDLAMHGRFHDLVDEIVAEQPRLVVADLAEAGFMDSTMLRELLRAHSALQEAGAQLIVAAPQPPILRLLELTGTDAVLNVADTREAALAGV